MTRRLTTRCTRLAVVVGTACALAFAATAHAKTVVVPPRPGQIGLGVLGTYGTLLKNGEFGNDFSSGAGLAVHLRYRMRYERAFGLSFESHNFDVRKNARFEDPETGFTIPADSSIAPKQLTLGLYGVEFYQLGGTRTPTTRFVSVGAGIAHPTRQLNDKDVDFAGGEDGLFVNVGAGVEHFFWQSWAWTLDAHYNAVFRNSATTHDVQAAAGLIFYASL